MRNWIAGLVLVCATGGAAATEGYCFYDLGTFGGPVSFSTDITDDDPPVVLGEADLGNDRHKGFVFSDWDSVGGLMLEDHVLGGGEGVVLPDCSNEIQCNTTARGMNASGTIVGTGTLPTTHHALRYSPIEDLGTLDATAGGESFGDAINDVGHVAGVSDVTVNSTVYRHAFFYDTAMVDLDAGLEIASEARAINEDDWVVGQRDGIATLWRPDGQGGFVHESLESSDGSIAIDVNDVGQVVGSRINNAASWEISADGLWVLSAVDTDFAIDSVAQSVNASGVIVGSKLFGSTLHAYRWTPDPPPAAESVIGHWIAEDLNDQPAVPSDWILDVAEAVNDAGWIAGSGFVDADGNGVQGGDENQRAFVLRPVSDVALCPGASGPGLPIANPAPSRPTSQPPRLEPVRPLRAGFSTSMLLDNGPMISSVGCGGTAASSIEPPSTYWGNDTSVGLYHQADDFVVPTGESWRLNALEWPLYMTGATESDAIVEAYVRLYDHPPELGSQPLAGDLTTNRLLSSEFDGLYRDNADDGCARPVQRVVIDMSWAPVLGEGTYWIELASRGDDELDGPWALHKVPRDPGTDNSRYLDVVTGGWAENFEEDTGAGWDYPFRLFGTGGSPALAVDATCPTGGELRLHWGSATPFGSILVVFAAVEGSLSIPTGRCADTTLGIGSPGFRTVLETDADAGGGGSYQVDAPRGACGGFMQMVDLVSCAISDVVPVR